MKQAKPPGGEDKQLPIQAPSRRAGGDAGAEGPREGRARTPDFLRIRKTIRVAVSGDVMLTDLERAVIDTPDFQRLRGVKQLGTVSVVYPTALHTRFDHSLGTLAMAERMLAAVKNNTHSTDEESRIEPLQEAVARLYALLHDITHVPFGHTIEDELGLLKRHDENPARIARFLGPDSNIGKLIRDRLGDEGYRRFRAVYDHTANPESKLDDDAFIYDLVSNTVCADLLDYLARDSYFCDLRVGLEYRFLNFLYIQSFQGQRRIFVRLWKGTEGTPRRDTLTDLARLLDARYLVAERAYFHHAKIISGVMLGRAIQEGTLAGKVNEERLQSTSDDILLNDLASSDTPAVSTMAKALVERRLHRRLHRYSEADFSGAQEHDHKENVIERALAKVQDPARRRDMEDRIAEEVGADPGDVLLYAPPRKMNMKAADMLVLWKGKPSTLKEIDDPVIAPRLQQTLRAHALLWGIHVVVSRRLTAEQCGLVREACDIELLEPAASRDARLREHYRKLIERQLAEDRHAIPQNALAYRTSLTNAVEELIAPARDARHWPERVGAAINKHFGRPS